MRRQSTDAAREQRFNALYSVCAAPVYAYACRRVGLDGAEDVVADTFAVAWRRLDSVPEPALPWLLATARRVIANRARGERRRLRLFERMRSEARWQPQVVDADAGHFADVMNALGTLSPREREAILLVAWDGLSGAEAAAAAGCSRAAFAVRLHRARRRLRKQLGSAGHELDDSTRAPASSAHEGLGP
ncbi:MAG TPA: sigma-70 family RNA polymerase sigma factor [Candidatus Dormibacteraeota bacterium]|nr:sigma-70 family RNA polymerase sigma factor [Candidatus Dormibacteraeota bacterium]